MEIYSQTDNGTLYRGDCFEVLSLLPSDSIDTMITDPPYGLSFMGKKWDYEVPGVNVWKQCLRVLKPGATALIFAGSRTQHRMAVNVEDAGFILKDTIMWIYAQGFPKSTDISKQLDKIAGKERKVIGKYQYPDGKPRHKELRAIGTGTIPDYDSHKIRNPPITAPATNEAKIWNGWGTALKPAYEPILVAMKPNDGTYAQNAMEWGVAGLNIDGGRIEGKEKLVRPVIKRYDNTIYGKALGVGVQVEPRGRFPANIILDEEAGRLLDEQSGILKSGSMRKGVSVGFKSKNIYQKGNGNISDYTVQKNTGGASRFFYCAKASKSERNAGCEELEVRDRKTLGDFINDPLKSGSSQYNIHPTVKPLALMEYLVKLTATPTGGTVFDPFAGSGTTGVACILNNRRYTLIEREIEYCEIIIARLGHAWFKNLC